MWFKMLQQPADDYGRILVDDVVDNIPRGNIFTIFLPSSDQKRASNLVALT
jgi:hypothetical protein